jgi:hypothetical protein
MLLSGLSTQQPGVKSAGWGKIMNLIITTLKLIVSEKNKPTWGMGTHHGKSQTVRIVSKWHY